jgi:predicted transglutaminase-like cysteine proteinase
VPDPKKLMKEKSVDAERPRPAPERMLELAAAQLEEMKEINQKLARVIELLEQQELAGHPT